MGIMLESKISRFVSPAVQQRGLAYFRQGRVSILDGGPDFVESSTRGTQDYDVYLSLEGDRLLTNCSCPYFVENLEPCKHIYATILAAVAEGFLTDYDPTRPVSLVTDVEDDEEDRYAGLVDDGGSLSDRESADKRVLRALTPGGVFRVTAAGLMRTKAKAPPSWLDHLHMMRAAMDGSVQAPHMLLRPEREILYVMDLAGTKQGGGLFLEVFFRERNNSGSWGRIKPLSLTFGQADHLDDPIDQGIVSLLLGGRDGRSYSLGYGHYESRSAPCCFRLGSALEPTLIPMMAGTGRFLLRTTERDRELRILRWNGETVWDFRVEVKPNEDGKGYEVAGVLVLGENRLSLAEPEVLLRSGFIFVGDRVERMDNHGCFDWINLLRKEGTIFVPGADANRFMENLFELPFLPPLVLPEEMGFEEVRVVPSPVLHLSPQKDEHSDSNHVDASLSFSYDGRILNGANPASSVYDPAERKRTIRDAKAEKAAVDRLRALGGRPSGDGLSHDGYLFRFAKAKVPGAVRALVDQGWRVEADGVLYRQSGSIRISVTTGIDWFELHGDVDFEEQSASLPALLAALRRGDSCVVLDDGTLGILPETWLKKYVSLAGLGAVEEGHIRFSRCQALLLDSLLASQPGARADESFARLREELEEFRGVRPVRTPRGFSGELRDYQQEGLGWFGFLERFGFGGCLADDMGLGKTIQVLALLQSRYRPAGNGGQAGRETPEGERNHTDPPAMSAPDAPCPPRPSLVVAPKSLIFNWKEEAARFTPDLRVYDFTGGQRDEGIRDIGSFDMVLTTYGILRRDIMRLREIEFEYLVLDEAQAIKNAATQAAKASRLIRAKNRLALSGTPIENHIGELWSLFEVLNPGMLGKASVFRRIEREIRNDGHATRDLLARCIRPFVLRRTKAQVAKELPAKTENTIHCTMGARQAAAYMELRDHYRRSLLGQVDREGIERSKIQILEALLRLRQAACHPGLIDPKRTAEECAKFDALFPQIDMLIEEGHKALVFSQFTSFLGIVRKRLEEAGTRYAYLDGGTRDRAAVVREFQDDPRCTLFLISLKAGGLGLNLTSAEYVFLLDPWWNPAVEAQAIDRTHRIGQTLPVFAYRLITKDTVEEKVLELQKTKKELVASILGEETSLIRELSREDLEVLFQ